MSNTKFTKGPWNLCVIGNVWASDTKISDMKEPPLQSEIYRTKTDSEQKANAHLISAAPELYDALDSYEQPLRVAINILHRMGSAAASEVADELRDALGASCSALAKARGDL